MLCHLNIETGAGDRGTKKGGKTSRIPGADVQYSEPP
jgi:hypothetical protein